MTTTITRDEVERHLLEKMAEGPFTSGQLQKLAYDIGCETPWSVASTLIKRRAKSGEIVCERIGPFAKWKELPK